MNQISSRSVATSVLAAISIGAAVSVALADGPGPKVVNFTYLAPGIAPIVPGLGPTAAIWYRSDRLRVGDNLQSCVYPEVRITGNGQWKQEFDLSLTGEAVPPRIQPVRVPAPIPASKAPGTTRELVPSPRWCVETPAGLPAPQLYLKTDYGRAPVRFAQDPIGSQKE